MGKISDGYHTFDELYEFRKIYNACLFNEWASQNKYSVHKSRRHLITNIVLTMKTILLCVLIYQQDKFLITMK